MLPTFEEVNGCWRALFLLANFKSRCGKAPPHHSASPSLNKHAAKQMGAPRAEARPFLTGHGADERPIKRTTSEMSGYSEVRINAATSAQSVRSELRARNRVEGNPGTTDELKGLTVTSAPLNLMDLMGP
jgi:hypothetical protein